MLVGEEAASSRMAGQTAEQEEDGLVSWTWSPGQAGGTINMYMYNNSMTMTNTNFSMDTEPASDVFPGDAADRMAGDGGGVDVSINMYMYDNQMSMDNTVFTMKVKP